MRSPDGDTELFDILAGVLHGDTLAPYLFIICLDYALRVSADDNNNLGLTLTKARSRRYPAKTISDIDYADDLALTSDTIEEATQILHHLEVAAKEIGLRINAKKTEFISFNQAGQIKSLDGSNIKSVEDFTYLGSCIISSDSDIQGRKAKAWAALNKMDKIWKSSLPKYLKQRFFSTVVESIQ